MSTAYSKELTLASKSGSTSVTLGGIEVKEDFSNEVESFARPDLDGGSPEHRALNLNRVERQFEVTATVDDDIADSLNSGSKTKEDIKDDFFTLLESGDHLQLIYGNDTIDGYVPKATVEEVAEESSSRYKITFSFLRSIPMTS